MNEVKASMLKKLDNFMQSLTAAEAIEFERVVTSEACETIGDELFDLNDYCDE